jgi:hypothetical protein
MAQSVYTGPQISITKNTFLVREMPKITARVKLIENVRRIVDNSRTHSVVCDLETAKGGHWTNSLGTGNHGIS